MSDRKSTSFIVIVSLAAVLPLACREAESPNTEQPTTLTAEIETVTKASVNDAGTVLWNAGDAISVFNGSTFDTMTLSGGEGSATGIFRGNMQGPAQVVALYPASSGHAYAGGTVLFHLPDSYSYSENGNARMPLMALVSGSGNLKFRHLGGVLKVSYSGIPAQADRFVFTAQGQRITGDFSAALSKTAILQAESGDSGNTVTVSFPPDAAVTCRTFYVPLPVGQYSDFSVTLYGGNTLLDRHNGRSDVNRIEKAGLLIMPGISADGNSITSVEVYYEDNYTTQW